MVTLANLDGGLRFQAEKKKKEEKKKIPAGRLPVSTLGQAQHITDHINSSFDDDFFLQGML